METRTAVRVNNLRSEGTKFKIRAEGALNTSAVFWVVVTIAGQWLFAIYIITVYGGSAVRGNLEVWSEILPRGIVKGDPVGNSALFAHIFFAVILNIFGPLQLIPKIRNRFPTFHRWNGRIFMIAGLVACLMGVYMNVTGGSIGDSLSSAIGSYLNALLIVVFAYLAWRYARARKSDIHRRWALRFFMVVSATFFIRVGFVLTLAVASGAGFEVESIMDPLFDIWMFLQVLLPLAILEVYLWANDTSTSKRKFVAASIVFLATLAMTAGLLMVAMGYWFPLMAKY